MFYVDRQGPLSGGVAEAAGVRGGTATGALGTGASGTCRSITCGGCPVGAGPPAARLAHVETIVDAGAIEVLAVPESTVGGQRIQRIPSEVGSGGVSVGGWVNNDAREPQGQLVGPSCRDRRWNASPDTARLRTGQIQWSPSIKPPAILRDRC